MNNPVKQRVYDAALKMAVHLPPDVEAALSKAAATEIGSGRHMLEMIRDNLRAAERTALPMCQDTGLIVVWIEIGENRSPAGLRDSIEQALTEAVRDGRWRASVVGEPLGERANTGTNLPAIFHWDITPGDGLAIHLMSKGFGSENRSRLLMLPPTAGKQDVVNAAVESVRLAGAASCPPLTVGVGIGGTSDHAAWLAKRALFRPLGIKNPNPYYSRLEEETLKAINCTDIGPGGFGGCTTALAVHVEYAPTHIAGLPVAINLNCWAARRTSLYFGEAP